MKKISLLCLALVSITSTILFPSGQGCDSCDCEITSRSYLSVRPQFQSASPELTSAFRYDRLHVKEDGWHADLQLAVFGGKSVDHDCDLTRYFFPFCKTSLIVDERAGAALAGEPQDLRATHFNISTKSETFRSEIFIRPVQSVVGVGIHHRHSFWRNEEKGRGFWGSISFPIERVKNDSQFCELVIDDGNGPDENADVNVVANMTQAFQQREWVAGKIAPCALSKTKIADIEFKLGYEWLQEDPYHLESYIGVIIPTGNKPTGEYLFEPIVGNGHHVGAMFGSSLGFRIWKSEDEERRIRVEYAIHSQYLFSNTQCRSVDLVCKPWSRYMEVYKDKNQAEEANLNGLTALATPGINVFTLPLRVRPGFSFNINTALVYNHRQYQIEAGHNFYARRAECVRLACPWQEGPALKHENGSGETNPVRDITGNILLEGVNSFTAFANYDNNVIKQSDLDLVSASHPCMLSHTFYGALGYRWDDRDYPLFISAGGSYELSNSNNAVLERWTAWGKFGFSF